jgi:hypothetical protein
MIEGRSSFRRAATVTLLFTLLWTTAMLWPALRAPSDHIVMDIGDPVLNTAILQWNARTLPLSPEWWDFPAFAPTPGVTAFTEHLLGLYPLATPLIWATGNPVVAYDLLCLVSFPLTALAMFALGRQLTGSAIGAVVAALAFTFSPYRVSHLSHIQMLFTFGMPLALAGLHAWVDRGARRGLVLFGAGWLFTAASNGYLMVFFGLYLTFWVAWFCSRRETIRRVPAIAVAGVVATLPLLPVLFGYMAIHREYHLQRSFAEIASYGADLAGIFRPWPGLPVPSMWLDAQYGEGSLFPGVAITVIALLGMAGRTQTPPPRVLPQWISIAAFAVAFLFLSAAVVAARTDIRYELAGLRLSITHVTKPLMIGFTALLVGLATSTRLRPVFASRNPVAFHVLMVFVMWVLSLGPVGRWNGAEVVPDLPYTWLLDVPGLMALRVPARFWLMATLSLAVLAGFGAATLGARRGGRAMLVLLVVMLLAEAWPGVAADPVDPFPPVRPLSTDDGPVLEIPLERVDANTVAMLRATTGGYRTINGYSGFEPPHWGPLRLAMRLRDEAVITELRRRLGFHVSVRRDNSDGLRSWLTTHHRDAQFVSEGGERALYRLNKLPPPPRLLGQELPFTVRRASCGHALLGDLADGSLVTRWECGRSQPGQEVEIDLGAPKSVSGIDNVLGPYSWDAPRHLRVSISLNATDWTIAWQGLTGAYALRAAFNDPVRMGVEIRFNPVQARYVRLTQIGDETELFWSIAELAIIGD